MAAPPSDLHELPLAEKLELLELLWSDIKTSPGYEPPPWHGAVLEERVADYRSGAARPLDFDQLVPDWRRSRPG